MIIKNYHQPKLAGVPHNSPSPANDLQIIEDVTDVLVYAGCFSAATIGENIGDGAGPTSVYGTENQSLHNLNRHIDFSRRGVRCRLIVTDHAYICNDEGRTVEKVSA